MISVRRFKHIISGMALKYLTKSKIELHVHLDGAVRIPTIIDLARQRNIPLPTFDGEKLLEYVSVDKPSSLKTFLRCFHYFVTTFKGDEDAIERIAYEFCEDQANNGVIYFETRYAPHLLANCGFDGLKCEDSAEVTPERVVKAVNRGLRRGEVDFGVVARSILCCMRHKPEWSHEVVKLCHMFAAEGVVGMDLAGDESLGEVPAAKPHIIAFEEARRLGIHRTVHAGEAGPAASVKEALDQLHAERIGHGYHAQEDAVLYDRIIKEGIHLELCLTSSILTGAVPGPLKDHPVIQFAQDGVNYSLNSDDPLVCQTTIANEYMVAHSEIGLDEEELKRATLNAAKSSFLPDDEKRDLLEQLEKVYREASDCSEVQ